MCTAAVLAVPPPPRFMPRGIRTTSFPSSSRGASQRTGLRPTLYGHDNQLCLGRTPELPSCTLPIRLTSVPLTGFYFMSLAVTARVGEPFFVLDLFESGQHKNIDQSGNGNKGIFLHNIRTLGVPEDKVVIHEGSSTEMPVQQLCTEFGTGFRFLSIDGGHAKDIVLNDLAFAECCLVDGGIASMVGVDPPRSPRGACAACPSDAVLAPRRGRLPLPGHQVAACMATGCFHTARCPDQLRPVQNLHAPFQMSCVLQFLNAHDYTTGPPSSRACRTTTATCSGRACTRALRLTLTGTHLATLRSRAGGGKGAAWRHCGVDVWRQRAASDRCKP